MCVSVSVCERGCLDWCVNMHEGEVSRFTIWMALVHFLYINNDCFSTFFDCCSYVFLPVLIFYLRGFISYWCSFIRPRPLVAVFQRPPFILLQAMCNIWGHRPTLPHTHKHTHTLCSHESAFQDACWMQEPGLPRVCAPVALWRVVPQVK